MRSSTSELNADSLSRLYAAVFKEIVGRWFGCATRQFELIQLVNGSFE